MSATAMRGALGLKLIGGFKLVLAVLLLLIGIGFFQVRDRDLGALMQGLILRFSFNPENVLVSGVLQWVSGLSQHQLIAIDAFTFLYAVLYGVEGVGLLMRKHWAEYLVIVVTGLLIPYEIYETLFKFSWIKCTVLVVNLAIVLYLAWQLRADRRLERAT